MHSVINALSMRVPSLVICSRADQRLEIIRMLGQPRAICFVENLDSEALIARVNDVWEKTETMREELESQTAVMREQAMLNGKLLKELLDGRRKR